MTQALYKLINAGNVAELKDISIATPQDELKERTKEHKACPLVYAIDQGQFECAKTLIEIMDDLDILYYTNDDTIVEKLLKAGQNDLASKAVDKTNIYSDHNKAPSVFCKTIALAISKGNQYVAEQIVDKVEKIELDAFKPYALDKEDGDYFNFETIHPPLKAAILNNQEDLAIKIIKKATNPSKFTLRDQIIDLAEKAGFNKLLVAMQEEQIKFTKEALFKQEANLTTLKDRLPKKPIDPSLQKYLNG